MHTLPLELPMGARRVSVCYGSCPTNPKALTSASRGGCVPQSAQAFFPILFYSRLLCSVLFCSVLCLRCTQTCVGRHGVVVSVRACGSPVARWGVHSNATSRSVVPRPGTTLLLMQALFGTQMGDWHQLPYHVHPTSCRALWARRCLLLFGSALLCSVLLVC